MGLTNGGWSFTPSKVQVPKQETGSQADSLEGRALAAGLRRHDMAEYMEKEKKLITKIVYYGPALSGKTTNLMRLHDILSGQGCGDLLFFETKGDRTLFFDLLPAVVRVGNGFTIKTKMFTVPGQVAHDATRKSVLARADAVVFVADSQNTQALNNFESFENLEKNIQRVGLDFKALPLIVQFNKRDLKDIISQSDVQDLWGPTGLPVSFASALQGRGVRETFEMVLRLTYQKLNAMYGLQARHDITEQEFMKILPQKTKGGFLYETR